FNLSYSSWAWRSVWGRRCVVCFIVFVPAYSRSGGSSTASRLSAGGSVTAIGVVPPGLSSSLSGRCASAHLLKPFSWLVLSEIYMTCVLMLQKVEVTAGGPPRALTLVLSACCRWIRSTTRSQDFGCCGCDPRAAARALWRAMVAASPPCTSIMSRASDAASAPPGSASSSATCAVTGALAREQAPRNLLQTRSGARSVEQ